MKSIFQLIRWQNLLMTAIVMWLMEKMVIRPVLVHEQYGELLPWWLFYLLTLSVVLIAAAGYAINDYFDTKIDAINRPDKRVVGNSLTKHDAMLTHQILTGMGIAGGIASAIVLRSWSLAIIFIFVPGILWFYSASYKRQFIIGNFLVALTTAMVPMVVVIANNAYMRLHFADIYPYITFTRTLYLLVGGFAVFAFLLTLVREIEKDLQDQSGDREMECHTMPIVMGDVWTKVIITLLLLATVALAALCVYLWLPVNHSIHSIHSRFFIYGLAIPVLCNLWLLWAAKISSDYRHVQLLTKFIMGIGMCYSFALASTF